MKTWRISTISLVFFIAFPVFASAGQFKVVRVYDGDTSIKSVGYDIEIKVRLVGIDEEATLCTLASYTDLMTSLIQRHRERVANVAGDYILAEFSSNWNTERLS